MLIVLHTNEVRLLGSSVHDPSLPTPSQLPSVSGVLISYIRDCIWTIRFDLFNPVWNPFILSTSTTSCSNEFRISLDAVWRENAPRYSRKYCLSLAGQPLTLILWKTEHNCALFVLLMISQTSGNLFHKLQSHSVLSVQGLSGFWSLCPFQAFCNVRYLFEGDDHFSHYSRCRHAMC